MNTDMDQALREHLAEELEATVRPLVHSDKRHEGGYDCCGCSTYDQILDHAIAIVLGNVYPPEEEV